MASPPPAKALAFDAFGEEGELEEVNPQKPTNKMSLKMPARLQQQLESRQQQLARRDERRQNNDGVGRPRSGRPSRYDPRTPLTTLTIIPCPLAMQAAAP
jgi:hypothetical protein